MKSVRRLALLAAALLGTAAAQAQPAPSTIYGTWVNPHGSVAVRTGACGDRLCGWVVAASTEAQQDARDGGTPRLLGTTLLEDYRPDGAGSWSGTVFVPDRNQRFRSTITQVESNVMQVKGCIFHGLLCRSQLWHRMAESPRG